jgi:negative regulator of flagellin synthesis FlgM
MQIKNLLDKLGTYKQEQIEKNKIQERKSAQANRQDNDQVKLSSKGQTLNKAMRSVQESPEMRAEKVGLLKEKVASGNYHPDSRQIAEKLVKEEIDLWS